MGTLLASIGGPLAFEMVNEIEGRGTYTSPPYIGNCCELRAQGAPWASERFL